MRKSTRLMLALGVAACGGEGVKNHSPEASAGAAGQTSIGGAGQSGAGQSGAGQSGASQSGAGQSGAGSSTSGGAGSGSGGSGGGSGTAGTGAGGVIDTPEMLVPTVKAFCAAARACCAKSADPVMLDDCESSFATKHETAQALSRGTATIDATDLANCLAAYEAAATTCEQNGVLSACAGIVRGKVPENAACQLGSECTGDGPKACSITEPNADTGVCQKVTVGSEGDACSFTCRPSDVCTVTVYGVSETPFTPCLESDGLYCDSNLEPAACQRIRAPDAACERDDQCGSAGYCDYGGSQTCKKRGQLNESCGMCIPSLSCIDGTCKSPPFTVGSTCQGRWLGP